MSWSSSAIPTDRQRIRMSHLEAHSSYKRGMLLEVDNLFTEFAPKRKPATLAVRGVSFGVDRGETLGIVGESGSGKSVTALSIARLLDPPGRTTAGSIRLDGVDLLALSEKEMRSVRGAQIAFVFQDPMTALNPVLTIGHQLSETIRAHQKVSRLDAKKLAIGWLERVNIALAVQRYNQYPYELSGGMRQRVMLAIAFSCRPKVLIADEPTTALDVTVQAQILDVIGELKAEVGTAVLLITHDLSIAAERCNRVVVMYGGQVVEEAPAAILFGRPEHPYTKALLKSLPDVWSEQDSTNELPYLAGRPPRFHKGMVPAGCCFRPRCAERFEACQTVDPALYVIGHGQFGRCLRLDKAYRNTDSNY
jgi:oligopeptide/dipeptide ABC transporter ATP-binding protein